MRSGSATIPSMTVSWVRSPELVSEREVPASAPEHLRQREHPAVRVVAPDRTCHLGGAQHPHRHPVPVQARHQPRIEVLLIEPGLRPEGFGAGLELGEVIQVALDQIGDLLRGKVRGVDRLQGSVGERGRERLRPFARNPVGTVEREHRPGRGGGRAGQLPQLGGGHVVGLQDRVAEHLHQLGDRPGLPLGGERLQVEIEDLGHADEERCRERAPVVLDQVQVARRDPEPLRELGLGQAPLPAQGANLSTQQGRFLAHRLLPPADGDGLPPFQALRPFTAGFHASTDRLPFLPRRVATHSRHEQVPAATARRT